jgi:hypothetical protein
MLQVLVIIISVVGNQRPWTGPLVLLQCIYFGLVPVSNQVVEHFEKRQFGIKRMVFM